MTNPFRWLVLRLRALVGRGGLEHDMQEEMREHLERATERHAARGLSPADARLAARQEFGNVPVLQEEGRDARGMRWLDALAGDARFAFRYFARNRVTTALIIVVLALGTGANALIFSLLQAQFLRPPPAVPDDDALARIWVQERPKPTASWQPRPFSQPELEALAVRSDVFQDVAAWTEDQVVLRSDSSSASGVGAQFVTPNYFGVLGISPSAGRSFLRDDDQVPDMTAVMAFAIARQMYGSAAAAVGQQVLVNEIEVHIVGVAPPKFQGALRGMDEPVLWMPLSARAGVTRISRRWLTDEPGLSLFARMAPGATHERATGLAQQVVANTLPDSAARVGMTRSALVLGLQAPTPGDGAEEMVLAFTIMVTIGVLILLVGWMNVSSLMVAAAVGRRHEIAVRLSLGASRMRVLRQLVTESTLLSVTGGTVGLLLAWWMLTWMQKTEIDAVDIAPDLGTFAFVLGMAVVTGILFGLSPAFHATRGAVSSAMRDSGTGGGSRRSGLQRGFVVAQIALSQPLLVILGVIIPLALAEYHPLPPEMARHVITVGFRPVSNGAPGQGPEAVDSLIPRIAGQPEVLAAVPESDGFALRRVIVADTVGQRAGADTVSTTVHLEGAAPGWFALVDVPVLFGRDVTLADTSSAEYPVVIGSDLARRLWGGAPPLGRTLVSPPMPGLDQDSMAMTVVGIYDATKQMPGMKWSGGTARGDEPIRVYTAHGKKWRHDQALVRTRGPAEPYVRPLQEFVRARAPSLPVTSMITLEQLGQHDYKESRQVALLAGGGGALAMLLASLGLYGVASLAVRQRTREIGIRIAIGARPKEVARMFLASGVRLSLVALALGLPLSIAGLMLGVSRGLVLANQVNPYLVGIVIAALLVAVASAATWMPARRASLVDPASTLRTE